MSSSRPERKHESVSTDATVFEKLYIQLRKKEQRLYSDEVVRNLPVIAVDHPHFKEWQLRKKSCDRLIKYARKKRKALTILEIGCGNGWLAAQLAKHISGQVTGMDVNNEELVQAARVFTDLANLKFVVGDIRTCPFEKNSFDFIVFAASLQYFPSLKEVIQTALLYLRAGGEIHILDTLFYRPENVAAARQRTETYYKELGFPEAAGYYFHHSINDLKTFPVTTLYDPTSWSHRFNKNRSPFPWFCIKNELTQQVK